jgi:hypothetical protein
MQSKLKKTRVYFLFFLFLGFFFLVTSVVSAQSASVVTSVFMTICGDGIVYPGQDCDDGAEFNTGDYSTTIEGRTCAPDCRWAPYCGDGILQAAYGEECDAGLNEDTQFCSADCKVLAIPPPGGGGGGGGGFYSPGSSVPVGETRITVQGKAYPNSNVNILMDGNVIGVVSANANADFHFTQGGVTPGTATLGFWAEDTRGLRSISLTVTLHISEGATTTVSGVLLPPTLSLDRTTVGRGEVLNLTGFSAPEVVVTTQIHSTVKAVREVISTQTGSWALAFNTQPLEEGPHSARTMMSIEVGGVFLESSFSQVINFFVGTGDGAGLLTADLNGDGRVNLIDFSILLFHWGGVNPVADINKDGRVNLVDFSIMLFQWTG